MKTIAVHPNQWREFCEAFTQLNKGSMINVTWHRLDGRDDNIASNEVFQKMTLDTSDACNNMISITLGNEGGRRMHHVVIEPIHLRIKENGEGQKLIQVEAENGVTLVTFHSGRLPQMHFESEFSGINQDFQRDKERMLAIPS